MSGPARRSGSRLGVIAGLSLAPILLLADVALGREPCADRNPLRNVYFGDLHVHTALSLDAATQGTRNRPRDAYRFSRGESLGAQPYDSAGRPLRRLRLARPLDFAAVTDHAELLGETAICGTPGLEGHGALVCRLFRWWPRLSFFVMNMRSTYWDEPERFAFCGPGGRDCLEPALAAWREVREAAEAAYDQSAACRFTTFVGYEWTGAPRSDNLHRNVIFRSDVVPELPVSYFEEPTPKGLWTALERGCSKGLEGCDFLAIPHNSNISGGRMFADPLGEIPVRGLERTRSELEPVVEIMQHKGDSECRLGAGTEDELCAFEKLPFQNFQGQFVPWLASTPPAASFVREALKAGLAEWRATGTNPFELGVVASTDTHLGTPGAVGESGYLGHGGAGTPARNEVPPGLPDQIEFNPGGLAALWAEENSRDALFDALRRREAYGTSGPRIVVRMFGGFDLPEGMCSSPSFAAVGDEHGVPMGGRLPAPTGEASPKLAVWALRDPGTPESPGAPLERIQIVKGWAEDDGLREHVFEVAGSIRQGEDPETCERSDEGASELCAVWTDPSFDPEEPAFYYARVLETPTCRWSTRQCQAASIDCSATVVEEFEPCCDPAVPKTIRERAWTSPIWFLPEPSTTSRTD